ncbi:MAG: N-acetylneuraminate synthase family protein, partial [Pseudomonadota bacterium]
MTDPVFVIAEAGVNHNGNIDLAMELVEKGALAGTDAIKFQTFDPKKLVTANASKADYQKQTTDGKESQ